MKTTLGNVFYSHKPENWSTWTIPDEIKEAVDALETEEQKAAERLIREEEATPILSDPCDQRLDGFLMENRDIGKPIGVSPLRINAYHPSQIPETGPGKLETRENGN